MVSDKTYVAVVRYNPDPYSSPMSTKLSFLSFLFFLLLLNVFTLVWINALSPRAVRNAPLPPGMREISLPPSPLTATPARLRLSRHPRALTNPSDTASLQLNTCCQSSRPWTCIEGAPASALAPRILRIGFITYATGPYSEFLADLWESLERLAFRGHNVSLFAFTDRAGDPDFLRHANVHLRQQARVGWPFDSLGRHFLFLGAAQWYSEMDYMISVDSDSILTNTLDASMLGERMAAIQAWFYAHPKSFWTNDRRRTLLGAAYSTAFISDADASCYFTGNLFGGSKRGFLAILNATTTLALEDLGSAPPRIALWHDESYLNRVFVSDPPTVVLAPNFMYPEPPADAWLYVQEDAHAARAWHGVDGTAARFPPGARMFLNLGVRKHASKELNVYQPLNSLLPAFMSPTGKARYMAFLADAGQLRNFLTPVYYLPPARPVEEASVEAIQLNAMLDSCCGMRQVLMADAIEALGTISTQYVVLFVGFSAGGMPDAFAAVIVSVLQILQSNDTGISLCSTTRAGFPRCTREVPFTSPLFQTLDVACWTGGISADPATPLSHAILVFKAHEERNLTLFLTKSTSYLWCLC